MAGNQDSIVNSNIKESNGQKMQKFWIILLLLLVLLIPIGFLHSIIKDRQDYRLEAINKVAASWGNIQTFESPEMYFEQIKGKDSEIKNLTLYDYKANVDIKTEVRKKGIFKIPVYTADVVLTGTFKNEYGNLAGKKIYIEADVKDSIGFLEEPVFKINNNPAVNSESTTFITTINSASEFIPFEISYKIRGLNELYLTLKGYNNQVKISGNWDSPSFEGNFLPANRIIEKGNFTAEWSVPKIAASSIDRPAAGVSLLVPVDSYRMADRTLKYAFLFLALTFISYYIFELTSKEKRKIHPLQYCLLGGAMQVFYLLLVSLSEFLSFGTAYFAASLMVISLIVLYTYNVITRKSGKLFSILIFFLMSILYIFLYILLSLEDFSLMIGSLGMFTVIAVIMYVTRNIDWYSE